LRRPPLRFAAPLRFVAFRFAPFFFVARRPAALRLVPFFFVARFFEAFFLLAAIRYLSFASSFVCTRVLEAEVEMKIRIDGRDVNNHAQRSSLIDRSSVRSISASTVIATAIRTI
jgi:hypothetical protein